MTKLKRVGNHDAEPHPSEDMHPTHSQEKINKATAAKQASRLQKPRPLRVFTRSRLGAVRIPRSLRTVLVDFTMTYLFESPKDVVKFGYEYFKNIRGRSKLLKKHGQIFGDEFSLSSTEDSECGKTCRNYCRKCGIEVTKCTTCKKLHRLCHPCSKKMNKSPICAMVQQPQAKKQGDEGDAPIEPHRKVRRDCIYSEGLDDLEARGWNPPVYPKSEEQRKKLSTYLAEKTLFKALEHDELETIVNAMYSRDVAMNEVVIRQGRGADYFYVVDSGNFRAYVKDEEGNSKILSNYEGHGSFGELALMYNVPRQCNVKALTPGKVWVLDRDTFRKIVIKAAMRKREYHLALLKSVPMLKLLSEIEMLNLADSLETRHYTAGEKIIEQGEEATGMFFVAQGKVTVSCNDEWGLDIVLDTLESGSYFGEMALLENQRRAATVTASNDVAVAFLQRDAFERLLGPCKEVMSRKVEEYEAQREEKIKEMELERNRDQELDHGPDPEDGDGA